MVICFIGIIYYIGKKLFEKCCSCCFCSFILSLLLFLFKMYFIPYIIGFLNVEIFKYSIHNSAYFYWNAATTLFYFFLFILCFIKDEINVCIYFTIGLVCSIMAYVPVYILYHDIKSAGVCAGLTMIEVIFQILAIYYAKKKWLFIN